MLPATLLLKEPASSPLAFSPAGGSPERNAKLRRFQEIVNGNIGLVPLLKQFDNISMRENVQGYVYYPDVTPNLARLHLG